MSSFEHNDACAHSELYSPCMGTPHAGCACTSGAGVGCWVHQPLGTSGAQLPSAPVPAVCGWVLLLSPLDFYRVLCSCVCAEPRTLPSTFWLSVAVVLQSCLYILHSVTPVLMGWIYLVSVIHQSHCVL